VGFRLGAAVVLPLLPLPLGFFGFLGLLGFFALNFGLSAMIVSRLPSPLVTADKWSDQLSVNSCAGPRPLGLDGPGGWTPHANQYLYFAVADLEAALRRAVETGCDVLEGGIQKMPWGERMFWCRDPFGNPIRFVDETTLFLGTGQ
jgi:Glyoxalase/Bleomycin resistance protein/Dioxygenase superfamily